MAAKRFSIRMEEAMLKEIRELAKKERRSVNKQIIFLVRSYMEKYEDKKAPLEVIPLAGEMSAKLTKGVPPSREGQN